MKRRLQKSLIKNSTNYEALRKDALMEQGPRDYSQPVDSAEAFKYRRKLPSERRGAYAALAEFDGTPFEFSSEEKTRYKDWGRGAIKTLIQNRKLPDRGLDPEWIDDPARKMGKEKELLEDYKNAGIKKVPGMEPINPNEAQALNAYYQQTGKPPIHIPTPEEYQSQLAQYQEMRREGKAPPMFNKSLFMKAGNSNRKYVRELEDFIKQYENTIRSRPKTWNSQQLDWHIGKLNDLKQKVAKHYKNKILPTQPQMPTTPMRQPISLGG